MISEHVASIEWDSSARRYLFSRSSLMGFGDDSHVDHDLAKRLAREYTFKTIDIPPHEKCLALAKASNDQLADYVELDDWARPITVKPKGLRAAMLLRDLLLVDDKHPEQRAYALGQQISELVLHESPQLRIALFRRAAEYAEIHGFDVPSSLFGLLPWEWLNRHLDETKILKHLSVPADPPTDLPDLASHFKEFDPHFAPALRQITEWREEAVDWHRVAFFIRVIWRLRLEHLPDSTRDLLFKSVRNCDIFLRRQGDARPGSIRSPDNVTLIQARVRANLPLNRIRVTSERVYLHRRVQNLETALILADDAGFLGNRSRFLDQEIVQEITDAADQLPTNPNDYLLSVDKYFADPSRRRRYFSENAPGRTLNYLLYGAEVCRFAGQIRANLDGATELGLQYLAKADPYYARAASITTAAAHALARVQKRWARKIMLEADIAHAASLAETRYRRALDLLHQVPVDEPDDAYGTAMLRANALLGIANATRVGGHVPQQIRREFDRAISESDGAGSITLLAQYYAEIEENYDAAIDCLDRWLELKRDSFPIERGRVSSSLIEYIEYYAAELASKRFEEDPSSSISVVDRFAKALKSQPTNLILVERFIGLFARIRASDTVEVRHIVQEHLVPISNSACPLTHAALHLISGTIKRAGFPPGNLSPAWSLALLVCGSAETWPSAEQVLFQLSQNHVELTKILEFMSKWYFDLGRYRASDNDLAIASRLLTLGLRIRPDDIYWVARVAQIALFRRDYIAAERQLSKALRIDPTDPVTHLLSARLALSSGQLDKAQALLERTAKSETEGEMETVHPAVLDNLAFVSLRNNQLEKAERFYHDILRQRKFDSRAEFGVGRVQFIRGHSFWISALSHWCAALRIELQTENAIGPSRYARRVAYSIAGLFREGMATVEAPKLLASLESILTAEDIRLASTIVDALTNIKIRSWSASQALMTTADSIGDYGFRKRVALFLASFVAEQALRGEWSERNVLAVINWCRRYQLIEEFLRSLSTLHARQLLELRIEGKDLRAWLSHLAQDPSLALLDQALSVPIREASDEVIAGCAKGEIIRTATEIGADNISSRIVPAVGLWRIEDILGGAVANLPEVGGFFDRDLLAFATQTCSAKNWRVADAQIETEIESLPPEE